MLQTKTCMDNQMCTGGFHKHNILRIATYRATGMSQPIISSWATGIIVIFINLVRKYLGI